MRIAIDKLKTSPHQYVTTICALTGGAEEGGAGGPGGDPAGAGSCSPTQAGLPCQPGAMVPWLAPTPPIGGWVVAAAFTVWGEGGDKPSVDPPTLLAWDC